MAAEHEQFLTSPRKHMLHHQVYIYVKCEDSDNITKTLLYYFDPLKPHLAIVKLGFTGIYIIFFISAQKHRLWVLV